MNPKNGQRIGGETDHEIVVTRRIRGLEARAHKADELEEEMKKIKKTPKGKLAEEVKALRKEVDKKNEVIQGILNMILKLEPGLKSQ